MRDCDACGTLVVTKNVHKHVCHESIFATFTQPADSSFKFATQILQNKVKLLWLITEIVERYLFYDSSYARSNKMFPDSIFFSVLMVFSKSFLLPHLK